MSDLVGNPEDRFCCDVGEEEVEEYGGMEMLIYMRSVKVSFC